MLTEYLGPRNWHGAIEVAFINQGENWTRDVVDTPGRFHKGIMKSVEGQDDVHLSTRG